MRTPTQESKYFGSTRRDLLDLVQGSSLRVLEIGCGRGETGARLLESGVASHVTGIEMDPAAAAGAAVVLSDVIEGDVESMDLSGLGDPFDCIIMGDVIEHLRDPWACLANLVNGVLSHNGAIVASIPNARCYAVWAPLVFSGRFTYRDSGLLDRTHLRWFTRSSLMSMFRDIGLYPEVCGTRRLYDSKGQMALAIMRPLGDFSVMQFLIRANRTAIRK